MAVIAHCTIYGRSSGMQRFDPFPLGVNWYCMFGACVCMQACTYMCNYIKHMLQTAEELNILLVYRHLVSKFVEVSNSAICMKTEKKWTQKRPFKLNVFLFEQVAVTYSDILPESKVSQTGLKFRNSP